MSMTQIQIYPTEKEIAAHWLDGEAWCAKHQTWHTRKEFKVLARAGNVCAKAEEELKPRLVKIEDAVSDAQKAMRDRWKTGTPPSRSRKKSADDLDAIPVTAKDSFRAQKLKELRAVKDWTETPTATSRMRKSDRALFDKVAGRIYPRGSVTITRKECFALLNHLTEYQYTPRLVDTLVGFINKANTRLVACGAKPIDFARFLKAEWDEK